jgi:hypothetical protein
MPESVVLYSNKCLQPILNIRKEWHLSMNPKKPDYAPTIGRGVWNGSLHSHDLFLGGCNSSTANVQILSNNYNIIELD